MRGVFNPRQLSGRKAGYHIWFPAGSNKRQVCVWQEDVINQQHHFIHLLQRQLEGTVILQNADRILLSLMENLVRSAFLIIRASLS